MKTPYVQPYLFFNGHAEDAIAFYQKALDAKPGMLMRFKESPDPTPPGMIPEGWEEKIMHADFTIGSSLIMVSDGCESGPSFGGFSLSISVETKAEADRYFNALAEGGKIDMPIGETFWSPHFGMVTDRFGVSWCIGMDAEPPQA